METYEIEARIRNLEERIIILEQQISDLAEYMTEAIYNFIPGPKSDSSEDYIDDDEESII